METTFILFIVVLLFILAISDLVVGVSNDAVNFLNSAIGSKVAPYKYIILTAILGIILGSLFSSGIMEVARKGIFYPQFFTFDTILLVFLAVMLTDIVLLDIFNTMGLPTSTTVSIIFELLGASLIMGILITFSQNNNINEAFKYINFESTGSIISGIFLSILIAFLSGIIIHYLTRLFFTFDYRATLKKYGAIYAGLGLTAIVYFLLIKGLKGTSLLETGTKDWIQHHTFTICGVLFVVNFLICFLLQRFAKVNPLKIIVLAGTFSLAMAFAGNDLVNFIGVPITGFLAYQNWTNSGVPADQHYQDFLAGNEVIIPNYMLLIAGIVMALTIWLSAKAKKVTETEVNLGRQDEGDERFKPNVVSRSIVMTSLRLGNFLNILIPKNIRERYDISFEQSKIRKATITHESPAFDLVRASSNLVIASILIAWATSLKLPLSTTYVSFMVAMGTSLADKAWGRESAVYRVAGVLSVIGGWFITAIIAFSIAGIFAFILYKGGTIGTIGLVLAVLTYILISHITFSKKERKSKQQNDRLISLDEGDINILEKQREMTVNIITDVKNCYSKILTGIQKGDKKILKKTHEELDELDEYAQKLRNKNLKFIKNLQSDEPLITETLVYSGDLIQDVLYSLNVMSQESLNYVKNLHKNPSDSFMNLISEVNQKMDSLFSSSIKFLSHPQESIEALSGERRNVRAYINEQLDKQISNIQNEKMGVKQSIFQTTIFLQSRDIQAVLMRIAKLYLKSNLRH